MVKEFNDQNFAVDAIDASKSKPVLVDFYANWCGPCKMQGPIVDQVAEEIKDKAVIGKVNVEEASKTAEEYGVMSIPVLIILKDGKVVETLAGLQAKDSLVAAINKYL